MRGTRPQVQWHIYNDNNHLQRTPSQSQIDNIITFCQNYPQHSSDFIAISLQVAPKIKLSPLIRVDTAVQLQEVIR